MTTTALTVFEQFEADLVCLEEANAGMDFNVESPEGEAECRAWHRKLRKGWNAVEKIRKETKADYIRLGKEVDEEAIRQQSKKDKTLSLRESGLEKVKAGLTSIEEVLSSTMEE